MLKFKKKEKKVGSFILFNHSIYFAFLGEKNHSGWKGYSVMYGIMFSLTLMDFTVLESTGNGKL